MPLPGLALPEDLPGTVAINERCSMLKEQVPAELGKLVGGDREFKRLKLFRNWLRT